LEEKGDGAPKRIRGKQVCDTARADLARRFREKADEIETAIAAQANKRVI